jgi:hypothetical protein
VQTQIDETLEKKEEPKVELWHVVLAFMILLSSLYLLKGKKKKHS